MSEEIKQWFICYSPEQGAWHIDTLARTLELFSWRLDRGSKIWEWLVLGVSYSTLGDAVTMLESIKKTFLDRYGTMAPFVGTWPNVLGPRK